jgi:MFS family permease
MSGEWEGGRVGAAARLALLFGVHAIGTANIMGVMAFAPAIQSDLDITPATFGWLVAAYFFAQPCVALPAGWTVDRVGVGIAMAAAMLLVAAATVLLSLATGPVAAAAVLVLGGVGYSLVNPATSAGVVAWFPPGWRSTMMGVKQAGVPMGGILAAGIAAVLGSQGWRMALVMVGVAATAIAFGALLAPRPAATPGATRPSASLLPMLRNAPLLRVCGATCLMTAGQAGFFAYLVLYLVGPMGLSPAAAAAVFGCVHAVSAVSRIAWGLLADRWWRGDTQACLRVVGYAGFLGFALLGAATWLGAPVAVAAALFLGATVTGFAGVAQAATVAAAPRGQVGAAIGLFMVLTPFGSVMGPPIFGQLLALSGGFVAPSLVLGALCLVAAVFVLRR